MQWSDSDSHRFYCVKVYAETPDAVSFELAPQQKELKLDFKPGQFASLGFTIDGKIHYRAYSISSIPGSSSLNFTVKRVLGGVVSNYIADSLQIGDEVSVLKPQGSFNCYDCEHGDKVALVSAGCGITPVFSMAQQWLDKGGVDIEFVHIARNVEHTIYYEQLLQLAQQFPRFHLKLLLKEPNAHGYPVGRLDLAWLRDLCGDIAKRSVFICGPESFMSDVTGYISQLEGDVTRCYQESFTSTALDEVDFSSDEELGYVKVHVPNFGLQAEVAVGSPLVDVLEANGLPIIVACRSGICGSCTCKVESGEVISSSRETLSDEQVEQGYVLACSTQVVSDVEVSLN